MPSCVPGTDSCFASRSAFNSESILVTSSSLAAALGQHDNGTHDMVGNHEPLPDFCDINIASEAGEMLSGWTFGGMKLELVMPHYGRYIGRGTCM